MKFNDSPEDAEKRFWTLFDELNNGPDRSVAIVGTAGVEEALSDALKSFLVNHKKSRDRLFEGNSPLSTFSAKIDLCRALGIIADDVYADLHRLRDIRNEFAHSIAHKTEHTKLSFETQHIRDKCLALRSIRHEALLEPRIAFARACVVLNTDIDLFTMTGNKVSVEFPVSVRDAAE